MAAYEDELEAAAERLGVRGFYNRLSPAVQDIVRADLIQAVGNALRFAARDRTEEMHMREHAEEIAAQPHEWGTF